MSATFSCPLCDWQAPPRAATDALRAAPLLFHLRAAHRALYHEPTRLAAPGVRALVLYSTPHTIHAVTCWCGRHTPSGPSAQDAARRWAEHVEASGGAQAHFAALLLGAEAPAYPPTEPARVPPACETDAQLVAHWGGL